MDFPPIGSDNSWQATFLRFLNHLPGLAYRCKINNDYSESVLEFASSGSIDLLGMTPEELVRDNFNTFERMTPAADLRMVKQRIRDSIVTHTPYQLMYRLNLPTGKVKWIWDQGEAVYDQNGDACYLEGLIMDVSEQKFQELALQEENRQLKLSADRISGLGPIVGKSEGMHQVYNRILKAAESDTNVIIYGETGCGKDLVARTIHDYSGRKGAYVPVNCGAIPESLLESEFFGHTKGSFSGAVANKDGYIAAAHNGTLFLDEIGELPMHLQVKLLRAIENKMYTPLGSHTPRTSNFRLVAATNQDLAKLVREKKTRSDFYYRINVLSITLPPLREREGDLALLIEAWCDRHNTRLNIPLNVRHYLEKYSWPGNVRELHNFLARYATFGEAALEGLGDLAETALLAPAPEGLSLEEATLQLEDRMIRHALEQCRWRRKDAAVYLGLNLRTLQRKMKRLGI